jgi:Mrp family chromosome partitioning ATPase
VGLADALEIGTMAEGCVFVVEAGLNQVSHTRSAMQRLLQGGVNIIGVLLTKFNVKDAGYGYEYAYRYQYDYD